MPGLFDSAIVPSAFRFKRYGVAGPDHFETPAGKPRRMFSKPGDDMAWLNRGYVPHIGASGSAIMAVGTTCRGVLSRGTAGSVATSSPSAWARATRRPNSLQCRDCRRWPTDATRGGPAGSTVVDSRHGRSSRGAPRAMRVARHAELRLLLPT